MPILRVKCRYMVREGRDGENTHLFETDQEASIDHKLNIKQH